MYCTYCLNYKSFVYTFSVVSKCIMNNYMLKYIYYTYLFELILPLLIFVCYYESCLTENITYSILTFDLKSLKL